MKLEGSRLLAVCVVVTAASVFFGLWVADALGRLAMMTPFSQP